MAEILLVEPDRNERLLTAAALRAGGHRVRAVATTRHAWVQIAQDRPDLLVVEARMPRLEGLQLVGRLLGSLRRLPVIVHAADPDAIGSLIASVADACVEKSADPARLLAAVERVLRRTELFDAPWRGVDPALADTMQPADFH